MHNQRSRPEARVCRQPQPRLAGPQCPALTDDERLVVALIRQIVIHGIGAPLAHRAMQRRGVASGTTAFAALGDWLSQLAEAARRQIAIGSPVRCCPSPDEVMLLAIITGAPRGDFAAVHGLLGALARPGAIDTLAHGAEQLGELLSIAGITLRLVRFTGNCPTQ